MIRRLLAIAAYVARDQRRALREAGDEHRERLRAAARGS